MSGEDQKCQEEIARRRLTLRTPELEPTNYRASAVPCSLALPFVLSILVPKSIETRRTHVAHSASIASTQPCAKCPYNLNHVVSQAPTINHQRSTNQSSNIAEPAALVSPALARPQLCRELSAVKHLTSDLPTTSTHLQNRLANAFH